MGAEVLPWVFTSGWASGINAYAVVLIMGLVDKFAHLQQIPDALARTDVLIGAAVLFLIEMVADKVPYVDSTWDSIHTVIRPAVGATLGYLIGHDTAGMDAAFTAATGGITALLSHLVKAGLRTAVNTSPEPVSNVVVSTGEDLTVAGVISLAMVNPWLAAGVAAALLAIGAVLLVFALRRVRSLKRRYDDWGVRMGIAVPPEQRGRRGLRRGGPPGGPVAGAPDPGAGSSSLPPIPPAP
ncbi:MAG: DUF4126 domain-containing protein [Actinomycetales bacterium]|jgi:hypothetical protein|nr:DUF4126 domain-containing protein [Candidatus Lutibacillus vidarii]HON75491.1 DUF4126 domain-containing protein [Dermatophilaceae bacterium]